MPANWDTTLVKHSVIGDYVTIARKADDAWYVGSITAEKARQLPLKLDFLEANTTYQMTQYADAANANWENNPTAYEIKNTLVKKDQVITLSLATGGGQAIILKKQK